MNAAPLLLVGAVGAVGVLHTIVPDHWVPIALIARERGWSRAETARAAVQAGVGHVLTTLVIALAVWAAGVAFAERFGHLVDIAASLALVLFGGWIAVSAWRELHQVAGHGHSHPHPHRHGHAHPHPHPDEHDHGDHDETEHDAFGWPGMPPIADDPLYVPLRCDTAVLTRHAHLHRHGHAAPHLHWHDHLPATAHPLPPGFVTDPPAHRHRHKTTARTTLLLILGSSPMVEGIPAFFAAARYGAGLIAAMAAVFALSTIATYVVLCVTSSAGLRRLRFGSIERYGEVASGAVIALVGVLFGLWPAL
jgi:ABC-type nickel/cobalt efflux system permease component RcnA